jgi:hypothetical protein
VVVVVEGCDMRSDVVSEWDGIEDS